MAKAPGESRIPTAARALPAAARPQPGAVRRPTAPARTITPRMPRHDSGPYSLLVGLDSNLTVTLDDRPENDFPQDSRLSDVNSPLLSKESMIEFHSINFGSSPPESNNRKSEILSQRQLCDISTSSPQVNMFIGASTPQMILKGEHIKENKNNHTLDTNLRTDETVRETKQFILGPLTRKQNLMEFCYLDKTDEDIKSNTFTLFGGADSTQILGGIQELPSPTVSENSIPQISKQNSFDESLGILTPDLMDSISFLDNVRSPSTDDLNDFLDSTKITEKTGSSDSPTPLTENVKSLTPDGLKYILDSQTGQEKHMVVNENEDNCSNENLECNLSDHCLEKTLINTPKDDANNLLIDFADDELLPSVHSSILDPLSSVVDTTVNLDLPLDSRRYDGVNQPTAARMDQTPSPEELPLDTIDIRTDISIMTANQFCSSIIQEQSQADSETKTDTTKSATSKVSNSFITSITSITSLDGYQGDGEMSRPVSRGADQSPTIGHRGVNNLQNHWQKIPINRRPDPMTDSDFFTESDADGLDEHIHRGDRRAQVIDGALYGGGKASNPPVMVNRNDRNANSINEDSCMESSGVFTDMETHRCSPLLLNVIDDLSPEGSTPSTRSELSQKNSSGLFYEGFNGCCHDDEIVVAVSLHSANQPGEIKGCKDPIPKQMMKPPNSKPSDRIARKHEESSTSSAPIEKMNKDEKNMALKKYKMPRRDVASKVKTMLSKSNEDETIEKRPSPKVAKKGGRWDAVMNKISAGKSEVKPNLKEVKSKVTSLPKVRTPPSKLKSRRVRSRLPEGAPMVGGSARSSPHSSQSDVSLGAPPPKHTPLKHPPNRNSKKRDVSRTQAPSPQAAGPPPALPAQHPPVAPPAPVVARSHLAPPQKTNGTIVKKGGPASPLGAARAAPPPPRKPAPRRAATTLSPRLPPPKDHPRPASPKAPAAAPLQAPPSAASAPAPLQAPALCLAVAVPTAPREPPNRGVEALAVLVHYLVFQLDALNSPKWRAQAAGARAQLSDAAARLQRALHAQTADHHAVKECLTRISELEGDLLSKESMYNASILSITTEAEKKYRSALEESAALSTEIKNLKSTLEQLRKEVANSREVVAKCEKDSRLREQQRSHLEEELLRAKHEAQKKRPAQPGSKEAVLSAEVESLKSVLELKLSELGEERRKVEQLRQAGAELPAALQRAQAAQTLADYLRAQLQRKLSDEANLIQENKQLHDSCVQMTAHKTRLALHNEELQYKLKHNNTVANLLTQSSLNGSISSEAEHDRLYRSYPETFVRGSSRTTASFNEKYLRSSSCQERQEGEWHSPRRSTRSNSSDDKADICDKKRAMDSFLDENSPPNSPKIKGVVEKSDSVSWIVEIEEPPEETVSRIVRQANSFRSSHPTREALKRQRPRPKGSPLSPSHPLSQSASASSLESTGQGGAHCKLFRSNSIEHKQFCEPSYSSTPNKNIKGRRSSDRNRMSESLPDTRPRASSLSHDLRPITSSVDRRERSTSLNKQANVDLEKEMLLPQGYDCNLVSNVDLALLQECESVPKESAGEALISGANSDEDSSLDERSHSPSDSESASESDKYLEMNGAGERLADPVLQKIAETMDQSLSTTPMEVSWSEDGECLISETDI